MPKLFFRNSQQNRSLGNTRLDVKLWTYGLYWLKTISSYSFTRWRDKPSLEPYIYTSRTLSEGTYKTHTTSTIQTARQEAYTICKQMENHYDVSLHFLLWRRRDARRYWLPKLTPPSNRTSPVLLACLWPITSYFSQRKGSTVSRLLCCRNFLEFL
jgi:hypothetical protein